MNPAPANPYAAVIATPAIHSSTGGAAMPATVSTVTGSSVIAAGQERSAAHNAVVLGQSGRKVSGGTKRKSKRKCKCKCKCKSKCKSKCKRKSKSKCKRAMSRRGGFPSASPNPSVMPVPQFAGAHNAGANANSLASNRVLTNAAAQRAFDNPAAPASYTKL